MSNNIQKAVQLTLLIQRHRRVTVKRVQQELGLSQSAVYRWLKLVAPELGARLEFGIITLEDDQKHQIPAELN
jgi:predicted transcriptional regulator